MNGSIQIGFNYFVGSVKISHIKDNQNQQSISKCVSDCNTLHTHGHYLNMYIQPYVSFVAIKGNEANVDIRGQTIEPFCILFINKYVCAPIS